MMYKIAICIPTYKRPLMLEKLLRSITACILDHSIIGDVHIFIVDNDIDKTGEEVARLFSGQLEENHYLHYSVMPLKGIVNVRNDCLLRAMTIIPDFIVFIDDDEYVVTEWLNELVKTILNNDADIVRGPVFAEVDKSVSRSISCWFDDRESYPDNTQISIMATGNVIMKRQSFQRFNIWFDPRFNLTGSSDYFWGVQLLKKGATFYWAANAMAFETIPKSRSNLKWLMKRVYRGGSTYLWILKLEKQYLKIFKKILLSIIYILAGFITLFMVLFPIKKRYWGVLKMAEGIGGINGLFNLFYLEYK